MHDMTVNLMCIVSKEILLNLNFIATFYGQRFPNSGNGCGWGWVDLPSGGVGNFTGGTRRVILTIRTFFEAENSFL